MTFDEAVALLSNDDDGVFGSELKNAVPIGFDIMRKYYDDIYVEPQHDVLYAQPRHGDLAIERWDDADIRKMGRLGWMIDERSGYWRY